MLYGFCEDLRALPPLLILDQLQRADGIPIALDDGANLESCSVDTEVKPASSGVEAYDFVHVVK